MPTHHLPEELLVDYAAGGLAMSAQLLVATHLALCPRCRDHVAGFEAIGGAMLSAIEPEPVEPGLLDQIISKLDTPTEPVPAYQPAPPLRFDPVALSAPEPLRSLIADSMNRKGWRKVAPGLADLDLLPPRQSERTRLMRITAGRAMPLHTHGGTELVLVLQGGFSDAEGNYRRGDVAFADSATTHRPKADDDGDCVCLAVVDGSLKLVGPIGRLLNLFFHY